MFAKKKQNKLGGRLSARDYDDEDDNRFNKRFEKKKKSRYSDDEDDSEDDEDNRKSGRNADKDFLWRGGKGRSSLSPKTSRSMDDRLGGDGHDEYGLSTRSRLGSTPRVRSNLNHAPLAPISFDKLRQGNHSDGEDDFKRSRLGRNARPGSPTILSRGDHSSLATRGDPFDKYDLLTSKRAPLAPLQPLEPLGNGKSFLLNCSE